MDDLGSPSSYLNLREGADCYSCDGDPVGTVAEVRAAPEQDIFDGIILSSPNGKRFVEAQQIEEIFERGVLLRIDRDAAEALPEHPA